MEELENFITNLKQNNNFQGEIKEQEPLSSKTTFKIGGKAAYYISPSDKESFIQILTLIQKSNIKYFILGGGSNIVFSDHTFQGIILSTEKLTNIQIQAENQNQVLVSCSAGTTVSAFVNFCTKNNLTGAEQFAGLPGTIGGALFMNARCFDKSISDILVQTSHIDFSSTNQISETTSDFNSAQWDYKASPFQNGQKLITNAVFQLTKANHQDSQQIEKLCKYYISQRVDKGHFKYPSAGSVFKNNRNFGQPSGQIIDQTGLKGYQIGGAKVAPFHGNFIINVNNATAADVQNLVQFIQKKVYEKYSFKLETEIIFVDN